MTISAKKFFQIFAQITSTTGFLRKSPISMSIFHHDHHEENPRVQATQTKSALSSIHQKVFFVFVFFCAKLTPKRTLHSLPVKPCVQVGLQMTKIPYSFTAEEMHNA